jgi:hypothetical protein
MVIECLSKEEDWKVLKLVLVQVRSNLDIFKPRNVGIVKTSLILASNVGAYLSGEIFKK